MGSVQECGAFPVEATVKREIDFLAPQRRRRWDARARLTTPLSAHRELIILSQSYLLRPTYHLGCDESAVFCDRVMTE